MYNKIDYPATLLCDFYKLSHRVQYPQGTEKIYSTWTPRESRIEGIDKVVAFGFQGFIKEYLIDYFNEHFFKRPFLDVLCEYNRVIYRCLGDKNPECQHIKELHNLGYLPILINAVDEGTEVPIRVPMLTIENTLPQFFWLTNFLETLMSNMLWLPTTSATTAKQYRRILDKYADLTCDNNLHVDFQAHDFSMRGMSGLESAKMSGAGHLLSFTGTDTIPAILYHEKHYNANIENELVGASIPASEHSVMCAGGFEDEYETYRRFIEDIYPNGICSIVSDTWDLWNVVTDIIPRLKDKILARDGKIVLRPDSGDPVKILCGDEDSDNPNAQKGVVELLWDIFGGTINSKGYKVLDGHIGTIYGDAITLERCEEICTLLEQKGFASSNFVIGVGSFTYQYKTRDTFGFALKSTYAVINGEEKFLFKDPKTDNGVKKSQKGKVAVYKLENGEIWYTDMLDQGAYDSFENNLLQPIFKDGQLLKETSLKEIRNILK